MVEVVLERSQHIIGFSPEAQVDNMASFFSQAGIVLSYPFLDRVGIFLQVSIGEVVLLCKEIRETLIDLTVENRFLSASGRFFYRFLEGCLKATCVFFTPCSLGWVRQSLQLVR